MDYYFRHFKELLSYNASERRGLMQWLVVLMGVLLFKMYVWPIHINQLKREENRMVQNIKDSLQYWLHKENMVNQVGLSTYPTEYHHANFQNNAFTSKKQYSNKNNAEATKFSPKSSWQKPYQGRQYSSRYNRQKVLANKGDSSDFIGISGIGPVKAKTILKYRDALGGFYSISQLSEVYGIDSLLYEKIKSTIILDDMVLRKLKINDLTANDLKNHPYIDWKTAHRLYNYKTHHGRYTSIEDIQKCLLNDKLSTKIAPYITFE